MARVFIVDPALKDMRGHHFNLTLTIAQALEAQGLKVICLANRAFSESCDLDVERCFATDTYDAHKSKVSASGRNEQAPVVSTKQESAQAAMKPRGFRAGLKANYKRLPPALRQRITPRLYRSIDWLKRRRDPHSIGFLPPQDAPAQVQSAIAGFNKELLAALAKRSATGDDRLLFHTSDGETFRDIVRLYVECVPFEKWNGLPSVHLCTPYDKDIMPHNKVTPGAALSVRRLRNLGLLGERVFLYAENEPLARDLAGYFGADVEPLCIPVTGTASQSEFNPIMRVGYLGPARTEKGFVKLPDLVAKVMERKLEVEFVVQVTPQILGYTPDVKEAVEQLRNLPQHSLRLLETPLSTEDYNREMSMLDVLVLNYHPDRYRVRGSGIAVEAVAAGKNCIVTPDTFPAFIVGDAGVEVDFSANAADAIEQLMESRHSFRARASARRSWYLEAFSGPNFVRTLMQPTGQVDTHIVPGTRRYTDPVPWQNLIR